MSNFSEEERERIRSQLVQEGRELFARFGFERTRVRDVTDAVGIGTSTFYQFFDSKTDLYVEVLCAEQESLAETLTEALSDAGSPREEVRILLETMFQEVRSNRLISRLIIGDELRVVQEELSVAERESAVSDIDEKMLEVIERWTENPEFRYDDPQIAHSLLRSVVFATRVQEFEPEAVLGVEYEKIEGNLIETLVDGLFTGS